MFYRSPFFGGLFYSAVSIILPPPCFTVKGVLYTPLHSVFIIPFGSQCIMLWRNLPLILMQKKKKTESVLSTRGVTFSLSPLPLRGNFLSFISACAYSSRCQSIWRGPGSRPLRLWEEQLFNMHLVSTVTFIILWDMTNESAECRSRDWHQQKKDFNREG